MFETEKYMGLWNEIGRTNNRFERKCNFATAEYKLNSNNGIDVLNKCYNNGKIIQEIKGTATKTFLDGGLYVQFENMPKFLKFLNIIPNYMVVDTDYDTYSIVRSFNNAWILSRDKNMSDEKYNQLLEKLPKRIKDNMVKNVI